MAKPRADGEGTIYKRTITRKDGSTYIRWEGSVTIGYKPNGKQNRKPVTGRTQQEVLEKMEVIKRDLATGVFVDSSETLEQFIERWLRHKVHEDKPQTVDDYRYQLEKYVIPRIGKVKMAKLRPMHIQNMCTDIADEVSPNLANRERRILLNVLGQAVRSMADELGHTNPSFTLDVYNHMFDEQNDKQVVSILDMLPKGTGEK